MLNKKLLIIPVTGAVLMLSLFSAKSVSAATATGDYSSIVQKLAEKFSLNPTEVQAVFDAHRTQHEADRQKAYETTLDTAVSEGKLTTAQKQLILNKHKEIMANRGYKSTMTKEQHQAKHTELQTWAKENGIDIKYLMFQRGRHGGMGKPMAPPAN